MVYDHLVIYGKRFYYDPVSNDIKQKRYAGRPKASLTESIHCLRGVNKVMFVAYFNSLIVNELLLVCKTS